MLTYLELGHDLFSSSRQYAFHCSMILLGELPSLLGRLQTPAELCGVHERFGSVMLALPAFAPVGEFLAPEAWLRPGNSAEPFGPDLLLAIQTGAIFANVQSAQGFFDLAKPARRAVKIPDGKLARRSSLNLVHRVRRLLDANLFSQAKTLCDLLAGVLQVYSNLQFVKRRCHRAPSSVLSCPGNRSNVTPDRDSKPGAHGRI